MILFIKDRNSTMLDIFCKQVSLMLKHENRVSISAIVLMCYPDIDHVSDQLAIVRGLNVFMLLKSANKSSSYAFVTVRILVSIDCIEPIQSSEN
jgi:hypothetical protein